MIIWITIGTIFITGLTLIAWWTRDVLRARE